MADHGQCAGKEEWEKISSSTLNRFNNPSIFIFYFLQLPTLISKEGEALINPSPAPFPACPHCWIFPRSPSAARLGGDFTTDTHVQAKAFPCNLPNIHSLPWYLETFYFRMYSSWAAELGWDFLAGPALRPRGSSGLSCSGLSCCHQCLVCPQLLPPAPAL